MYSGGKNVDKILEELRKKNEMSTALVARKLNIDRRRLINIEKGKSMLPVEFIPVLARLYDVTEKCIIEKRLDEWKKEK
jgi:transcriptional regulator with XRE-family HTH domain